MFCIGCGQPVQSGEGFCAQCGQAVATPPPQTPLTPLTQEMSLDSYASRLKLLTVVWFVWSVLVLLTALQGLSNIGSLLPWRLGTNELGFLGGPSGLFFGSGLVHLYWIVMLVRALLIATAAWGLRQGSGWGRILAIVLSILSLFKFPFGTAIGIWTLIVLLGRRNAAHYAQLQRP